MPDFPALHPYLYVYRKIGRVLYVWPQDGRDSVVAKGRASAQVNGIHGLNVPAEPRTHAIELRHSLAILPDTFLNLTGSPRQQGITP